MSLHPTIPVLICAYSRYLEFCNVLNSAISSGSTRVYINIDGSVNEDISFSQSKMIDFIEQCRTNYPNIEILVRKSNRNLGAAISVISSIDWFFSKEEFGLIVEDDLQFNNSLFDFVAWSASNFKFDPDIWIISGSNFFGQNQELRGKIHFPSYPVTWGWATWSDKWNLMREEIVSTIEPPSFLSFDPVSNFWQIGAVRAKKGIIDAWDIPLAEAMRRLKKLSVVPPVNLVRNIGFSNDASNTKVLRYPLDLPIEKLPDLSLFNNSPLRNISSVKDVNYLYEKKIYGISSKNALTSMISHFDFIRIKKYSAETLISRLRSTRDMDYRMF